MSDRHATCLQRIAVLEAERDALRAALRQYGIHAAGCDTRTRGSWMRCTCGLDALLAAHGG